MSFSAIEWVWPWVFFIAPLPLLFYIGKAKQDRAQSTSAIFLPIQSSSQRAINPSKKRFKLSDLLLFISWLLFISALARPSILGEEVQIEQTGRDVFLAVDISGSMREEDMSFNNQAVDRLTLVKGVLDDFIAKREGDRLGLILFGSQAYIQAPLTFDLKTLQTLLNESQIGFAGQKTAIGDAIGLGIKRLQEHDNDNKVLILLTDGQNTAGSVDPIQASQIAKEEGVVIYTIGIGSDQPQSRRGIFSFGSYNPSADLDVKTLNTIAQVTQGKFYRATNQADLQAIYADIDALEQIEQDEKTFRPRQEWFFYPLSLSILLLILYITLLSLPTLLSVLSRRNHNIKQDGEV